MPGSSNWLDRFVGEVSNLTDTPEIFIRAAAYFTAASALKKSVFFWSSKNVYANLYYLLVAPPGKFRKTTVLEIGQSILHAECGMAAGVPLVSDNHFLPQDGSDVAFDDALGDANGFGIAYYEEFSKFIGSAKREHTSGMQIKFLEYFTPNSIDKKTKTRKDGERVIGKGTVVNFCSACTDDDFESFVTSGGVSSGQLSRMLIFRPTDEDARAPFKTQPSTPADFYMKMAKELRGLVPMGQRKMVRSTAAEACFAEACEDIDSWYAAQINGSIIKKSTARITQILERLSLIHAAMRGSGVVEVQDFERPRDDIIVPYLTSILHFNRFGYLEHPDQILRARIYRALENGNATPAYVLARNLNQPVSNIDIQLKVMSDHGHIYSIIGPDNFKMWVACEGTAKKKNTMIDRAEKAMVEFRRKMKEQAKKNLKIEDGAMLQAQEEEAE